VVILSPVVTLKELAERTYDAGRAYLVVDRIAEPPAADTEFLWRQVEQRVKTVDAFLAMTVSSDAPADSTCGFPAIPLTRPSLEQVVRSHLDDMHAAPDVSAVVAVVPDDWRMATLARLLRRLRRDGDLSEAAAEFDTAAFATVNEWIKSVERRELLTVGSGLFPVRLQREVPRVSALPARSPDR
jgi:hypothetical protein